MDNNELILDIKKEFKILNNINDNSKDKIIQVYISNCIDKIINLTNRNEFPKELKNVVLDMLNDFYITNINIIKESINDNNFITSISEEGRSVNFNNTNNIVLSSLLSNHIANNLLLRQKQLNRYRLLYKVSKNE